MSITDLKMARIPLSDIDRDPDQPRKDFDPEKLQELADNIKAVGVITPIEVKVNPLYTENQTEQKQYVIVYGERRWRASEIAGLADIPCYILDVSQSNPADSIYHHQLSENLFREELNPVELAEYMQQRIEYLTERGVEGAQKKAAEELGVSQSWLSKKLAVLKYPADVRAVARDGYLRDYATLKKIAALPQEKQRLALELIKSDEFNAVDFFKKKRRPASEVAEQGVVYQSEYITRRVSVRQWIWLIENSEFCSIIEAEHPKWRGASTNEMKAIIKRFMGWVDEHVEPAVTAD